MAWYWMVLLGAAVLAGALYGWGAAMPKEHVATMESEIGAPPAEVFERIADFEKRPVWRKELKSVVVEAEGRFVVEDSSWGKIRYEVMEREAPRRLVTRIADDSLAFGGTWTIKVEPAAGVSRVSVREDGFVKPPVFRVLSKYVFGHTKTMEGFLTDLRASFQSPVC